MNYWLMKSEPDVYAIWDLEKKGRGVWEGVRNYQARNHMREMKLDDLVLFYHSNATPPGVVGVMKIVREAYVDPFQLDPKSEYYDPKSKPADPRWSAVDVGYVETLPKMVSLDAMKADPELSTMLVCQKGTRLSVTPVSTEHFAHVLRLGGSKRKIRT